MGRALTRLPGYFGRGSLRGWRIGRTGITGAGIWRGGCGACR
ncbi:hypothetical protein [Planotetraspora sp. GP83]